MAHSPEDRGLFHNDNTLKLASSATPKALLDAIPASIALLDSNATVTFVNAAWRRFDNPNGLHGTHIAEGEDYLQLSQSTRGDCVELAPQITSGVRSVLTGSALKFALEYSCRSPRRLHWFRLMVTPLNEERAEGAVIMHIDITDRKQADLAVQESEERFKATFEQAAVGMAHVSPEGRFLRVNDKLCEITGYEREELLELTFLKLTFPEDLDQGTNAREQMLSGRQAYYTTEKRYIRKNGEIIWINLATSLVRRPSGEPNYFISVFRDVTLRKVGEFRLERLNSLYAVLSKVSEVVVRTTNRQQLFESVCRIAVERGHLCMVFVAEVDSESAQAHPVASYGRGVDYLEDLLIKIDDSPFARGTIGTAIRTGSYDICNDISSDHRMTPWREAIAEHRFKATASFPIKEKGATMGALVLFADEIDFFQEDEIKLMVAIAEEMSFALEAFQRESERQRIERELRSSESNLATAQGIAHFGSWELNLRNKRSNLPHLTWSDEMFRIAGFHPGAFVPTSEQFYELVHPEDRKIVSATVDSAIKNRQPYKVTHRLIRPNGEERVVHHAGHIFFDPEADEPSTIIGTSLDVTDQHKAEESIRVQAWMLDHIGQAVIATDTEGAIIYANRFAGELHGWAPGEMIGADIFTVAAASESQEFGEDIMNSLYQDHPWNGELPAIHRDGRIFPVSASIAPLFDKRGSLNGIISVSTDISERKRAERELSRINRALTMLSQCNKRLIHAKQEHDLIHNICEIAVEVGGYHMAWVGYANDDEARMIIPMAHAGAEEGYLSEIILSWSDETEKGRGPAGQSIRKGHAIICEDITANQSFFYWLEPALRRGYRGVICLPLRDEERTFGLIALYSAEVNPVGEDEVELLQELADNLAFGIKNLQAQEERQRIQSAVLKISASVSARSGIEFFEQLSRNMSEALRGAAAFVARLIPGSQFKTVAAFVDGTLVRNFEHPIEGTPCEHLLTSNHYVVTNRVRTHFIIPSELDGLPIEAFAGQRLTNSSGETIGLIFVAFSEPLKQTEFISSTLQIFASRAAAELEREETDARIREQASLLDKAQDAILVRGLDHRITYWNKSAERLYGWSAEEAIGCSALQLLYKEDSKFQESTAATLQFGEWMGELHQVTRTGQPIIVEGRWTLVRDRDGRPKGILAINTDITDRKKFEQQFLRAQRMESIGTLAGGIAHDLNNVLAPITMAMGLLKLKITDSECLDILTTIGDNAQRGAEMVGQVLSFARGMEGRRVPVDAKRLICEIEKIARDTFPKNIEIRSHLSSDLWQLEGDPTQLHQVLLNFCVNARDAMPHGGKLTITAENIVLDDHYAAMNLDAKPGPHLAICVEDTGSGIPQTVIDKIFDPFFTTKEFGKGTGLGLSTSLAIVKSHGGFIRVYSEPGRGTRFHLYIPTVTASEADQAQQEVIELPRGNGETVLVIDDEASIRGITRQTLEAFGYRVILACDGAEAVTLYVKHRDNIAVVLTDMMMPIMDGISTIHVLKKINPSVKMVAASGINTNLNLASAAGVKYFVPKPYTADVLLKTLKLILEDPEPAGNTL